MKKRHLLLMVSLIIGIPLACQREELPPESTAEPSSVTIAEAKSYFEQHVHSENSVARKSYTKYKPGWERAIQKRFKNRESYVLVPLEDSVYTQRIVYDSTTRQYNYLPELQLIIYRDKQGNKQMEVMELQPTTEYARLHPGYSQDYGFSGTQRFYSWNGELRSGFIYQNGQQTGRIESTRSNGRTSGTVCRIVYRYYIYIACYDPITYMSTVYAQTITVYEGNSLIMPPIPPGDCNSNGWQISNIYTENECYATPDPPNSSGGGSGGGGTGSAPSTWKTELTVNKLAMVQACPGADSWKSLIDRKAPSSVTNRLNNLTAMERKNIGIGNTDIPQNLPDNWEIQTIKDASGAAINLDYFPIKVVGSSITYNQFVEYMRLNINSFVNTAQHGSFTPHPGTNTNEAALWRSSNPVGAIISISIPVDNGSVIVTEYMNNPQLQYARWTFATIHDPWNNDHPVSGNREFGAYKTPDGFVVYTRGADRLTGPLDQLFGVASEATIGTSLQFLASDAMWKTFQSKVAAYFNRSDIKGSATVLTPTMHRPNWAKVKEAIENNRSLTTVPCR